MDSAREPLLTPDVFNGRPGVDARGNGSAQLIDTTWPTLVAPLSLVYIFADWAVEASNSYLLSFLPLPVARATGNRKQRRRP